jgi:hypothetical protein
MPSAKTDEQTTLDTDTDEQMSCTEDLTTVVWWSR